MFIPIPEIFKHYIKYIHIRLIFEHLSIKDTEIPIYLVIPIKMTQVSKYLYCTK